MPLTQYASHYVYDKGLNLTNIQHNQSTPQLQDVLSRSNRLTNFNYDLAGNQLDAENVDEITYNHEGQMASTKTVMEGMVVNEYYIYGAPGHRVKKVTKTVTGNKVTKVDIALYLGNTEYRTSHLGTDLFYDGEKAIAKSGTVTTIQDNVEARIKSGHGQVAKMTKDNRSQGKSYSYNLINNIDSNSVALDNTSNIISHQNFYPYGSIASTWGEIGNKQLGYSGQEKDSTQFNYYGYRYYHSLSGRWTRPDPIRFQSGQLNLYAMIGGNPISVRDERGLTTKESDDKDYENLNKKRKLSDSDKIEPKKKKQKIDGESLQVQNQKILLINKMAPNKNSDIWVLKKRIKNKDPVGMKIIISFKPKQINDGEKFGFVQVVKRTRNDNYDVSAQKLKRDKEGNCQILRNSDWVRALDIRKENIAFPYFEEDKGLEKSHYWFVDVSYGTKSPLYGSLKETQSLYEPKLNKTIARCAISMGKQGRRAYIVDTASFAMKDSVIRNDNDYSSFMNATESYQSQFATHTASFRAELAVLKITKNKSEFLNSYVKWGFDVTVSSLNEVNLTMKDVVLVYGGLSNHFLSTIKKWNSDKGTIPIPLASTKDSEEIKEDE